MIVFFLCNFYLFVFLIFVFVVVGFLVLQLLLWFEDLCIVYCFFVVLVLFFGVFVECVELFVVELIENVFDEIVEIKCVEFIFWCGFGLVSVELFDLIGEDDNDEIFLCICLKIDEVVGQFLFGVVKLIFDDQCILVVYIFIVFFVWNGDGEVLISIFD